MTGDQTHTPSVSTRRRRLLAVASDRILELPHDDDRRELWLKLEDGWRGCGWATLFRNGATGTVVGLPDHCDKIACPYCELRRASKVRDRYRARHDAALAERRLYLAVLTIPNVPLGELAEAYRRLRGAIAKLRRRPWWADVVAGGLWRLEVTINLRTRTWHPHANLLFETNRPIRMADWQPAIQAEWRRVSPRYEAGAWRTGAADGQWVWLKPGWDGAIAEAVKRQIAQARDTDELDVDRDARSTINYTVKPDPHWIDPSDPAWVVEYVEALARSRTVSSFGDWRGLPRPAAAPHEETVSAPYAFDGDFFAERRLPLLDPLTDTEAVWEWAGRGPRHALRPHRPPGDRRDEWLVWSPGDGDPPDAVDDTPAIAWMRRWPDG